MKKFLIIGCFIFLFFTGYICFAVSNPSLPDSFKVEVSPSEFSADELVNLKITAMKYDETMENYEGFFDIVVIDADGKMLQSDKVIVPDGGWGGIKLQEKGVKVYEKGLTIKESGEYKISVTEFTDSSIVGEATVSVSGKASTTTSVISSANESATNSEPKIESDSKLETSNQDNESLNFPDSFKVEVNPKNFYENEYADLIITAMKNGKTLETYQGSVNIVVIDSNGTVLQSSDVVVPDSGQGIIREQDGGMRKYSKGIKIKKSGDYKILVSEYTDDSISGEASISVVIKPKSSGNAIQGTKQTDTTKTQTKTQTKTITKLSNDEIIQLLNKKGITIRKTWKDFKPDKNIRRDEAAKMLSVASKKISNNVRLKSVGSCAFNDLDDAWSDLRDIVKESCKLGLFKGNNNKFNPSSSMTNAQLLTVVGRMLYGMQNESGEHYAKVYIEKLTKDGYLSEMNLTKSMWDSKAKRGDIAVILLKIVK